MQRSRLLLLLHTVRHLSVSQIRARIGHLARRRWWRLIRAESPLVTSARRNRAFVPFWDDVAPAEQPGRDLSRGVFRFAGQSRERPAWHQADVPRLWRYYLHYFDYARDLAALAAAGERKLAYGTFKHIALSWIRSNGRISGDGWHPYTVSLRIANWCGAAAFFAGELDDDPEFGGLFLASLYGQARFLSRNRETDVRGNHLLTNLTALICAGTFFEGDEAQRWRAASLKQLEREVAEQVLDDGGHFERAPWYHVQVLQYLRNTLLVLRRNDKPPPWLETAVAAMEKYLRLIVPPSGRLPLLKDSILVPVPSSRMPPLTSYLPASGYVVSRDDRRGDFLIADYGRVGPEYNSAHAHADMFSFELSVDGSPLVVDAGIYEYQDQEWRHRFRSTAAHNTVEVEEQDQSEIWSSFRIARRARLHQVSWSDHNDVCVIQGEHDGYTRLPTPVTHRRTMIIADRIWAVVDELFGRGDVRAKSRIHLHPGRAVDDLHLTTFGDIRTSMERGWYSEQFGEKEAADVVVFTATGTMPLVFGYCIAAEKGAVVSAEPVGNSVAVTLDTPEASLHLLLPRDGPPVMAARAGA
ncbi:MAG: hypothetical protein NVSMB68_13230 [Thermoanaerobaculia bacterium]